MLLLTRTEGEVKVDILKIGINQEEDLMQEEMSLASIVVKMDIRSSNVASSRESKKKYLKTSQKEKK